MRYELRITNVDRGVDNHFESDNEVTVLTELAKVYEQYWGKKEKHLFTINKIKIWGSRDKDSNKVMNVRIEYNDVGFNNVYEYKFWGVPFCY